MDWGTFWTWAAQTLIILVAVFVVFFVGSAILAGIRDALRKEN